MEILIISLIFAAIPALIAPSKGRSAFGWFLIGVLISPLLAFLLVVLLPNKKEEQARAQEKAEKAQRRPCPRCGEGIMYNATLCRFCQTPVTPMARPAA